MIHVTREKIIFSLPNSEAVIFGRRIEKEPLERDLVSAHVCPYCGVLAQATYYTDKRVEDLTKDHFGLEKPASLGKFAVTTARHESQPKFKSYLLSAGGKQVELIREDTHFNISSTRASGCCKIQKSVWFPGQFNLIRYLFAMTKVESGEYWHPFSDVVWERLRLCLMGPDPELNQRNADVMFTELSPRINIAQDTTENGSPMWLLAKQDFGYSMTAEVIKRLTEPQSTQ